MTRLIEADKAVHDLGRSLCDSVHELEAINVVASQPTVDAIPITWIEKHIEKNKTGCFDEYYGMNMYSTLIETMLKAWKKERDDYEP